MRNGLRVGIAAVLLFAFALVATGASQKAGGPVKRTRGVSKSDRILNVFVAASLADVIGEITHVFERAHPEMRVRLNIAGSQQLAAHILHGQTADLFVSADDIWIKRVAAKGRLSGKPVRFAINRPVVIVSRKRGGDIRTLQDLAEPGVKLVLGAPPVPIGRYAREAFRDLSGQPGYPGDFARRVMRNVVSEEENVKGVVGKVRLGEADAGVVYFSDVTTSLSPHVRLLEFPNFARVRAPCWIAVLKGPREAAAREFVTILRSDRGRRALASRGFVPVTRE